MAQANWLAGRLGHSCTLAAAACLFLLHPGMQVSAAPRVLGSQVPRAKVPGPQVLGPLVAKGQIYSLAGYPGAICNDGTPGAYYFRAGTRNSKIWLFYLEGGSECNDATTCSSERSASPLFTTSTDWSVPKPGGIVSSSSRINPTFYDANVVQVHYCSSDYWSGAKTATTPFKPGNASTGWTFQGRAIALAALQDLAARDAQTGLSSATAFTFAGSSAGGLGAVYLINDLLPYAPAAAAKLLVVDAGYSLSIGEFDKKLPPTYMSSVDPTITTTEASILFWNGHGDTACAQAATTQLEQVACYNTATLINGGYIKTPTLVAETELDTDQLGQHGWFGTVNQDAAHMTYATEFADAMKALLEQVGAANSVFAPQRLTHTLMSTSSEFQNREAFPGFTEAPTTALYNWYQAPAVASQLYGDAAGLP